MALFLGSKFFCVLSTCLDTHLRCDESMKARPKGHIAVKCGRSASCNFDKKPLNHKSFLSSPPHLLLLKFAGNPVALRLRFHAYVVSVYSL